MKKNFLPKFSPRVNHGVRNTLTCLIRNKAVRATPEELVRQRILNWLLSSQNWPRDQIEVEKNYEWIGNAKRRRVRLDIELHCDNDEVIVIECKNEEIPLGDEVEQQAKDYAVKADAEWIWTTNGRDHRILKKETSKNGNTWVYTENFKPLNRIFRFSSPRSKLDFPKNLTRKDSIAKYWQSFDDNQFHRKYGDFDEKFVLSFHKMIFGTPTNSHFPYSYGGVHILEHRSSTWHKFSNRSGGLYHTRYADFIAGTLGCVEAVSLAVNRYRSGDNNLRICIGLSKSSRTHHALQLDVNQCKFVDKNKVWIILHDGRMSQISKDKVIQAVKEAGCEHWIEQQNNREILNLGSLPYYDDITWVNCRRLLANLIHYALIRSNLREAQ